MPRNDQMKPFRWCFSYCRARNLPWKGLESRRHISVHLFYHRDCMKEGWSRPVTSIGKLPSSLDRKITLFRENNTLVSAAGAPRQHSLACVCASKSPRCRCQPEYKGSLYMISMHLCKTYWTKKPCPECCSTPINGLRNYFERRLVVRQLWYVAGEAFLLCSVPAMRPGHVLIIQQQEDICLYWVTRPRNPHPALPASLKAEKWADRGCCFKKAPAQMQTSNLSGHFRWRHHLVTAQRTKPSERRRLTPVPFHPWLVALCSEERLWVVGGGVEREIDSAATINVRVLIMWLSINARFSKSSHSRLTNK